MLTAFNINSTDIRIKIAFRRASTPYTPSANRSPLSTSTCSSGIIELRYLRVIAVRRTGRQCIWSGRMALCILRAGDHDGADEGDDQDQRRDLERDRVVV